MPDRSKLFKLTFIILFAAVAAGIFGAARSEQATSAAQPAAPLAVTDQISQFGITWTFDQEYDFGQFANGDYWVVGPVTIIEISPPSTETAGRVINGSMINPSPLDGATQGYDSSMYGQYGPYYDVALNAARPNNQNLSAINPLVLPSGSSLVSSISVAEAGARPQLETAAVLTILSAAPPDGSFRPPYSGGDKTIRFNLSQVNSDLLAKLPPVAATPALADVEGYFERPWIDHVPNWLGDYHHPEQNLPNYGRDISARVGAGALMLHLDIADKETLLVRYIQLGIDLYGVAQDGGDENWVPNGGHASGRKWPIMFAGLLLGDSDMQNIGPGDGSGSIYFGEDAQTFYVTQADIDLTHDPDLRECYREEYEQSDLGLAEWGIRHATHPSADNKAWCAVYRQCCTGNAWAGFVLSAWIMDAKDLWNHDPLFDYQDRFMDIQIPGDWRRCADDFTEEMWDTYRDLYGRDDLELWGTPADQEIQLSWRVNNVTLPISTTWTITYQGTPGTEPSPITGVISSTRTYSLTGLTNYEWYTVTLSTVGVSPILSDTVSVMPTDLLIYLSIIQNQNQ